MSATTRRKKRIRLTPFGYLVVAASFVAILIAVCLIAKAVGKKRLSSSTVDGSGNPLHSQAGESINSEPGALDGIINAASAATNEPTGPATPTPVPTPAPTPTIYFAAATVKPGDPTPSPSPARYSRTPTPDELNSAMDGKLSTGGVNLRAGPSKNDAIIGTGYAKGTRLKVYSLQNDFYFVQIVAKEMYGFVSAKFVSVDGMNPEPIMTIVPENAVGGYISASKAMLRTGPGTDNSGIREIRRNTPLYVYYSMDGWYYVEVAQTGEAGYVKADFVTTDRPVPESTPMPG
ncbi:MAG: SH3 domain-containing protein [Clostridia bacterium]|nr:SH3 domain-containing protein [Clostridia bacterium]MBR0445086.1 SH3 domain-containing protein [Clostridia bacterium]